MLISQKFDAAITYGRLSDAIRGVSHYFCVTQMAMALRQLAGFDGRRLARLTALITGGAPNPEAHSRRWLNDAVPIINAWGMSEIGSGTARRSGAAACQSQYICGGENVSPAEIEAVIVELTGVSDVAVFGVPHDTWGETGAGLVVVQPESQLDAAAMAAHSDARLARFKVPRVVEIVASLPRTASGKIEKHLLRAFYRP